MNAIKTTKAVGLGSTEVIRPCAWADAFGEPSKTRDDQFRWPLYDQPALAMLAGELQALRDHVAHWERGGIDVPAIARADDALRLYHGAERLG